MVCENKHVRKAANVLVGVAIFFLLGSVVLSAAAHLTFGSITDYQNNHWIVRGLWKECDHYDLAETSTPIEDPELICKSYYTKGAEVARVFLITDHIVCILTVPFLLLLGLLVMDKHKQQQHLQQPQEGQVIKWQPNNENSPVSIENKRKTEEKQRGLKFTCTSFVALVPILAALHCILLGIACGVMTDEYLNIANTRLLWGTIVPWIGWVLSLINIIITCFIYVINLMNSECHQKRTQLYRHTASDSTANNCSAPGTSAVNNPQPSREITTRYNYECKYTDTDSSGCLTL